MKQIAVVHRCGADRFVARALRVFAIRESLEIDRLRRGKERVLDREIALPAGIFKHALCRAGAHEGFDADRQSGHRIRHDDPTTAVVVRQLVDIKTDLVVGRLAVAHEFAARRQEIFALAAKRTPPRGVFGDRGGIAFDRGSAPQDLVVNVIERPIDDGGHRVPRQHGLHSELRPFGPVVGQHDSVFGGHASLRVPSRRA